MVCNDSGYQAISFDKQTHIAKVNGSGTRRLFLLSIALTHCTYLDNCTGCTLCHRYDLMGAEI